MRHATSGMPVEPELLVRMAVQRDCDLLCLQEFPRSTDQLNNLTNLLRERTPLKYRYCDTNGNFALFSAFPIIRAETSYFPNRSNGFQSVDLKAGNSLLRVFNVHLQSNAVTQIAERVASHGDLQTKETWLDIRGMLGRFKRAAQQRALQSETLASLIAQCEHPVLVLGDLNDTPHSYTYRTLSATLQDSFTTKGRGLGITYAGKIPALRIDYIMAAEELSILEHRTEPKNFSDHRAVWARIGFRTE